MWELRSPKFRFILSILLLYAILRLGLFVLYGGSAALAHTLNMFFNVCIYELLLVFYIGWYIFLRRKIKSEILVVIAVIVSANIIAYFTMEDFHKIYKTSAYGYYHGQRSVWESIKSTYFEGFNYIAWIGSIICLLFTDLKFGFLK